MKKIGWGWIWPFPHIHTSPSVATQLEVFNFLIILFNLRHITDHLCSHPIEHFVRASVQFDIVCLQRVYGKERCYGYLTRTP